MGTVAIGFVTSWFFAIALFFSMGSLDELTATPTLVPILALFEQALHSTAGAIVLEALFIATGIWCLVASQTWQSRNCWSFARDGGLPFSKYLAQVDKRVDVPLRAHFVSSFIVALVGLIYLGSYTAFNSMVTACIVLLYISYAIPVTCLLIKGRNNIRHGPFWLGPIGLFSNIVLLIWTVFTLIMYSFPSIRPVQAGSKSSPLSPLFFFAFKFCHSLTSLPPIRHELRLRRLRCCSLHHHRRLARPRAEKLQRANTQAFGGRGKIGWWGCSAVGEKFSREVEERQMP